MLAITIDRDPTIEEIRKLESGDFCAATLFGSSFVKSAIINEKDVVKQLGGPDKCVYHGKRVVVFVQDMRTFLIE